MQEDHNLPENKEEIIDILAKAKYLKIDTDLGSISLESHNSINVQPKGTPFGVNVRT